MRSLTFRHNNGPSLAGLIRFVAPKVARDLAISRARDDFDSFKAAADGRSRAQLAG
ncbi:hypothetical protein HY988_02645 [Candidatus Micrarchaeota archaeon]|nr:hypothetical protein [Candidatus Micrarchaeota archaeon]